MDTIDTKITINIKWLKFIKIVKWKYTDRFISILFYKN